MTRRHHGAAVATLVVAALTLLPACTDDGGDELSVEEFCEQVEVVRRLDDQLGQVETLEIEDTFAELEELTDRAPADIQPSMEVLTASTGEVVTAMAAVEPGDTEGASDALTDLLTDDELAQAEQAGRDVEAYVLEHCAYELRTGGTVAPTTAPPSTEVPASEPPATAG